MYSQDQDGGLKETMGTQASAKDLNAILSMKLKDRNCIILLLFIHPKLSALISSKERVFEFLSKIRGEKEQQKLLLNGKEDDLHEVLVNCQKKPLNIRMVYINLKLFSNYLFPKMLHKRCTNQVSTKRDNKA